MARIYLDWAASAPPFTDIVDDAARLARESFGNPSSIHAEGRSAEGLLSAARRRFAEALGLPSAAIYFSSGGTESNNIVLSSLLGRRGEAEIVVSGIEHASVYEPARALERFGIRVRWLAPEPDGAVDPDRLAGVMSARTAMVAVMQVNNETGALQPIGEIAKVIREGERRYGRPIHFHCDAVQALGKIAADYAGLDVDSASFSGHKLGGLRGAGALYLRKPITPLFQGGGQERGIRPGTENLSAIWSLAEATHRACRLQEEHYRHALVLRRRLAAGIAAIPSARFLPGNSVNDDAHFSPFILSVAFPPLPGEVLVRVLDDAGCAVSTGSACSSKKAKERRVLSNLGIDGDTARSAIRISTGYGTTEDEIERFLMLLHKEVSAWSTPLRV